MKTLWLIPLHVRPVISYEGLIRSVLRDPATGLDRFNLTDVGEAFFRNLSSSGFDLKIKGVDLPFPWEMIFKLHGEPKVSLRGIRVGPSTYRSIFKLIFEEEGTVSGLVLSTVRSMGRDPLDSPYWDDSTWEIFQGQFKMDRDSIVGSNRSVLGTM
jgi:hypothetical protein